MKKKNQKTHRLLAYQSKILAVFFTKIHMLANGLGVDVSRIRSIDKRILQKNDISDIYCLLSVIYQRIDVEKPQADFTKSTRMYANV